MMRKALSWLISKSSSYLGLPISSILGVILSFLLLLVFFSLAHSSSSFSFLAGFWSCWTFFCSELFGNPLSLLSFLSILFILSVSIFLFVIFFFLTLDATPTPSQVHMGEHRRVAGAWRCGSSGVRNSQKRVSNARDRRGKVQCSHSGNTLPKIRSPLKNISGTSIGQRSPSDVSVHAKMTIEHMFFVKVLPLTDESNEVARNSHPVHDSGKVWSEEGDEFELFWGILSGRLRPY